MQRWLSKNGHAMVVESNHVGTDDGISVATLKAKHPSTSRKKEIVRQMTKVGEAFPDSTWVVPRSAFEEVSDI